jgi:hypothetical protein
MTDEKLKTQDVLNTSKKIGECLSEISEVLKLEKGEFVSEVGKAKLNAILDKYESVIGAGPIDQH